jgi:hypothetical protein
LTTTDDEVDLSVGRLERTIGVAPLRRWWQRPLFAIVVVEIMVILATSIIASIVSLVVATIIHAVVMPIAMVVAMVIVASVVAVIVTATITSIPIIVAMIGPAITVITSIRSTVTIVKALATVPFVLVVALGLFGVGWYSKGTFQLLALPHGVLGIAVELTLVVHDHVEVTFKEGGRSWWICHVGFTRSLV